MLGWNLSFSYSWILVCELIIGMCCGVQKLSLIWSVFLFYMDLWLEDLFYVIK
jgi:hypothetical protein